MTRLDGLRIAALLSFVFATPAAAQNADNGKRLFEKCLACHAVGPGAANKNGPVLNGVAGRVLGGAPDFTYSDAFKAANAAGRTWTDDALSGYLAAPLVFLPKNKMAFGAVADAGERADIIAYLKTLK